MTVNELNATRRTMRGIVTAKRKKTGAVPMELVPAYELRTELLLDRRRCERQDDCIDRVDHAVVRHYVSHNNV